MTLNCYNFKFSRNFALLRSLDECCSECMEHLLVYQGCRALTSALGRFSCKVFVTLLSVINMWHKIIFEICFFLLFRLQPNLDTRQKQVDAWMSLVLAYHRYHKKYTLDVTEIQTSPLFNNTSIDSIFCILQM